jgi:ABC-type antimicrobial peptide transport system permease subunit
VVGDITYGSLGETPELAAYYSYQQMGPRSSGIVLRGAPSLQDLRHVIRNLDPNIPLTDVKPLGAYLGESLASRRFLLGLLTTFSGLAILLAAMGLYAVLVYSVQQRKQEIGIRVAFGATSGSVLWLILRECLTIAIFGAAAGLVGAVWTTSFLKSMLYGITTTDLAAYGAAIVLILAIALAASLAPALRAARIDPLTALRYE